MPLGDMNGPGPKQVPSQIGFINPKVEFGWDCKGHWEQGPGDGSSNCMFPTMAITLLVGQSVPWNQWQA